MDVPEDAISGGGANESGATTDGGALKGSEGSVASEGGADAADGFGAKGSWMRFGGDAAADGARSADLGIEDEAVAEGAADTKLRNDDASSLWGGASPPPPPLLKASICRRDGVSL